MEASLRFLLRKDLANKKGEQPIVLMVSMGGQKRKISTGIALLPELWSDEKKEIVTLTSKKMALLEMKFGDVIPPKAILLKYQAELNELKFEIQRIEERLRFSGIPYDSHEIVSLYKESKPPKKKEVEPEYLIYDFIDLYIRENELSRVKGSMVVYKSLKKHLKNFENEKCKRVRFENMDYSFMQEFQNFLIDWQEVHPTTGNIKQLNNITIAKQISTLKTFLGYARRRGIKTHEGYKEYSVKKDRLEVIALNQKEFDALYALDVSSHIRLSHVKDIFLFSCVTGYRFSDLLQLKREHIKENEIRLTITKTKEQSVVPLTRISKEILKKYEERVFPLPMISNQKFNKYVKELCELAEIKDPVEIVRYRGAVRDSKIYPKHELVSAHTGRKTFVTLSLAKGIPAEVVMKITGHSDYKSFKRYVEVDEHRKRDAMSLAWD